MTWVKLDDHMSEHPKVLAAGPLAAWLHVCALQYASRNLTDGFVPSRAVPTLANFDGINVTVATIGSMAGVSDEVNPYELALTLVDVGLWEETERGYQIHDYLEFNPSKAEVMAQRRQNADRQAAWKDRKRGEPSANGVTNAVSNAVSNGANNAPLTPAPYPVPVPVTSREETGDDPGEATTAVVAVAAAAKPERTPRVGLVDLSDDARAVLEEWRLAHGKRSPPKLNPTQAADLEEAVLDLGLERLFESARWSAKKGVTEFAKCLGAARTKRQHDEAAEAPPVFLQALPPRSPKHEAQYQARKQAFDRRQSSPKS